MSEMLANRYLLAGKFAEAIPVLEKVLRRHPGRLSARRKLIAASVLAGQLETAVELAMGVLRNHPDSIPVVEPDETFRCDLVLQNLSRLQDDMEPAVYAASRGVVEIFCDESAAVADLGRAAATDASLVDVGRLQAMVQRHMEVGHV